MTSGRGAAAEASEERLRAHRRAFIVGNIVLTGANVMTGLPWWAFWPLIMWSGALFAHYLIVRLRHFDQQWIDERTRDLRGRSYDNVHIMDIVARHDEAQRDDANAPTQPPRNVS